MKRLIVYSPEDYVYMEQLVYEAKKEIKTLETFNKTNELNFPHIKKISTKLDILYKILTYNEGNCWVSPESNIVQDKINSYLQYKED